MSHIRSLRPNVTREEAEEFFSSEGLTAPLRRWLRGPLRSVAAVYIPFRLFEIELNNAGRRENLYLAVDAVKGNLDPYHFSHLPTESDIVILETRNCPPALLDDALATNLMVGKFRRLLFSRGFFKLRSPEIRATPLPGEICVPYWVGFRGHHNDLRFDVIDAVRRRPEGAKVRKLLHEWLSSAS